MSSLNNVETSLNAWLADCGLGVTLFFIPLQKRVTKETSISVTHHTMLMERRWQGDRGSKAGSLWYEGVMDISVWVNRAENADWLKDLRELSSKLMRCIAGSKAVKMNDYDGATVRLFDDLPANERGKIYLGEVSSMQSGQLPDPDIEQRRFLIDYFSEVTA